MENIYNDPSIETMNKITEISTKFIELKKLEVEAHRLQLEMESADLSHPYYLDLKLTDLSDTKKFMQLMLDNFDDIKVKLQSPHVEDSIVIEHEYQKFVIKFFHEIVPLINKWDSFNENSEWASHMDFSTAEKLITSLIRNTTEKLLMYHNAINKLAKLREDHLDDSYSKM